MRETKQRNDLHLSCIGAKLNGALVNYFNWLSSICGELLQAFDYKHRFFQAAIA